jgi:hypothetical protein
MIGSDICKDGGSLVLIYVSPLKDLDINNPVLVDGVVDDIPWLTPSSPWIMLEPVEDDAVNIFEEKYNDSNEVISQSTVVKIEGITSAKLEDFRRLQNKCALAVLLVFSDGSSRLQGLDKVFTSIGWVFIPTLATCSVTETTNTSAIVVTDNILVSFKSVARNYAIYISDYENLVS